MYSVANTIDQLAPRLPEALVGPAAHSRLRIVAGTLPAELSNWIYLECRLRGVAPRVDLIVRVDQRGRDILAGSNHAISLDCALHKHPVWHGLRALAREWSEPSSPLYRGVERLWLEFDIHAHEHSSAMSVMPAPGVFVELAREAYAHHSKEERIRTALLSLRPFLPDSIAPDMARGLRRCWELLPAGGCIPYVGIFPGRASRTVRVSVAGIGDADLLPYLGALRWPGSHRRLARTMATLLPGSAAPRPRMTIVNLDVGAALGSNVGIEYLLSPAAQLHGAILETAFLEQLVSNGLCSAAKRDALLSWPGTSTSLMRHELWKSRISRRVNHVKLAYVDDELPEVKCYLSASHDFYAARSSAEHRSIRMQPSTR